MSGLKLCMPAMVYLVLALIGVFITMRNNGIMSGGGSLIFVGLWTWFLNYLCSKGHSGISWFLVFLPLIGFVIMILVALEASMNKMSFGNMCPMCKNMPMTYGQTCPMCKK